MSHIGFRYTYCVLYADVLSSVIITCDFCVCEFHTLSFTELLSSLLLLVVVVAVIAVLLKAVKIQIFGILGSSFKIIHKAYAEHKQKRKFHKLFCKNDDKNEQKKNASSLSRFLPLSALNFCIMPVNKRKCFKSTLIHILRSIITN